jgi:uncharacterized protein (DUF1501 family)
MKRRTFLQSSLAATAVAPVLLGKTYARPSTPLKLLAQLKPQGTNNNNILILVQLFGGNDGLNTIIPSQQGVVDPNYYTLRPNIGIAESALTKFNFGGIYFNPGLANVGNKGGLFQMFQEGSLAVIRGIGYNPPNLSHFYSTDVWLSGIVPTSTDYTFNTGWLGRMLEMQYPDFPTSLPADPLAINLGGFSLALDGSTSNMGIVVDNPSAQTGGLSSTDNDLDANATGTRYETEFAFVQGVAEMSNTYAARVKNAYSAGITNPNLKGTYGSDTLAQQLKTVAALIAGGLNTSVYVVGTGGFDFHINEVDGGDPTHATGAHTNLLGTVADAIAQFQSDMVNLGSSTADRVIGFTVSEFGRRPYDNGSYGTDHGAASVQFAFGTQINGGVFGDPPGLAPGDFDNNGDLMVQIDFRSVYSALLTDWFGMSLTDAQTVLQDQTAGDVANPLQGLIKSSSGVSPSAPISLSLSVYPNPMASNGNITLALPNGGYTEIEMTSMDGKNVQQILARTLAAGNYTIPLTADVPSGAYLISLRSGSDRVARVVEVIR